MYGQARGQTLGSGGAQFRADGSNFELVRPSVVIVRSLELGVWGQSKPPSGGYGAAALGNFRILHQIEAIWGYFRTF